MGIDAKVIDKLLAEQRATDHRHPLVIVKDKLQSYGAARRVVMVMPASPIGQHRYLNNRAENSHQPTREERRMRRFKSTRPIPSREFS